MINTSRLLIALCLGVSAGFAADEAPKSPATILYDKAVADNTRDLEKLYSAYTKGLEVANQKVIKVLEAAKADLNDPKKGKLTIQERAKAIEELDGKISDVKKGSLGDRMVAGGEKDLLGDAGAGELFRTSKDVVAYLAKHPKWKGTNGQTIVFDLKQMKAASIEGGKVTYNETITQDKLIVHYGGCKFDFTKSDGKTIIFVWPKGETDSLTLVEGE